MERTIFHVDVNSAFLSWEAVYRIRRFGGQPDLRTIPSAVAGDIKKRHGIILAKSIPAKPYGIETGMTVVDALQKCPNLRLVPPNHSLYRKCSGALMEMLGEYTPDVEGYSIDEAFLDMTSSLHLFGGAVETADGIRKRIESELGFTVNIGISTNKVLAKMAGELKKPNLTHTLYPDEIEVKMWPLPVSELFFCGQASAKRLKTLGIRTIGDLAGTDLTLLRATLGKQGEILWNFSNGIDESEVISSPPEQKSCGNSTTAPFDVTDSETANMLLLALSETVAERLRKAGLKAGILSVEIRDIRMQRSSHRTVFENATNITQEIYRTACRLLDEMWTGKVPLRQLGIRAGRLKGQDEPRQLNLFDKTDYAKLESLDCAVDRIRERYGNDSMMRATFLQSDKIQTKTY